MPQKAFIPYDVAIVVALAEEFKLIEEGLHLELRPLEAEELVGYQCYSAILHLPGRDCTVALTLIGDMGPEHATLAASRLVAYSRPRLVISVGISGSLRPDVRLGDVVVATEIYDYLFRGKAVTQRKSIANFTAQIESGGRSFETTDDMVMAIQNWEFTKAAQWRRWQSFATSRLEHQLTADLLSALRASGSIAASPSIHVGPIACGSLVGASTEFREFLKSKNRNLLALDMESCGVAHAVRKSGRTLRFAAVRGISDFADENKMALEDRTKGSIRNWAMLNALDVVGKLLESEYESTPIPAAGAAETVQSEMLQLAVSASLIRKSRLMVGSE